MFSLIAANDDILSIISDTLIILISLWTVKLALVDLVSSVKFYGLNIKVSDESIFLYNDKNNCHIPLNKDVRAMYCMLGWLLIWSVEDRHETILIRNSLLTTRYLKLESHFKSKTNYLSSLKEKRKVLKEFQINVFKPLKYVRWPALI